MKRFLLQHWSVGVLSAALMVSPAWGRGFGGGGFHGGGGFGGGFHGGGFPSGGAGGFSAGGGFSGAGFRPTSAVRPSTPNFQTPNFNRPSDNFGGTGLGNGGFGREGFGGGDIGLQRPNLVHPPGSGGSAIQVGDRPQPGSGNAGNIRPGAGGTRPATLPGLNSIRPGMGESGAVFPGMRSGSGRAEQNSAGDRLTAGRSNSIADRHQELADRFDNLQTHGNNGDWQHQQGTGPNGGDINHIGYWGPNGYWGHTGIQGANGGYWGHSTGIGPNGAFGHTTGIGPNGAVWGHGGVIGPNGAFGYAGYAGPAGHWSRNWGGWYNGYAPAWGHGRWNYLWNSYPVAMAFGATMWGINAVNWAFGVGAYYNPYCDGPVYVNNQPVVSYTEPIVGDSPDVVADPASDSTTDTASADPLAATFDQARQAFFNEQYTDALNLTNQALVQAPHDAAINEFRSLCLFALGQYRESAATIHAVLAAGPGWDWTTMISLYSNRDTYTVQLRKLEAAVQANPQAADSQFLLAYHYLTTGYTEQAVTLWKNVVELQPKDDLAAQLVQMYSPVSETSSSPATPAPDVQKPAYPLEKLYGDWIAKTEAGEFSLHLGDNDEFTWKFTRDNQPQSVSGAYLIRGNNLVMQPDSGGTMLSTITLMGDQTLDFAPLEGGQKLTFVRR